MRNKRISIVVPMYNESAMVHRFFEVIDYEIRKSAYEFEVIVVNDGSLDDTREQLEQVKEQYEYVGVISFSRNFGHEAAIAAGFEYASGDAVITMDADLQDPPAIIHDLIKEWENGYLVINAKRVNRQEDAFFKRVTASMFYYVINMFNEKVRIPNNVGNYRLMDRVVVDEVNALPEKNRVFRVLVPFVGYKTTEVPFIRPKREAGETHYNWKSMFRLALDSITSATTVPLKLTMRFGMLAAIVGFIALIYTILAKFLWMTSSGWASIMSAVLFMGGVQLMFLGVIGEYIGRIFHEVKDRPAYIVYTYDAPNNALEQYRFNTQLGGVHGRAHQDRNNN